MKSFIPASQKLPELTIRACLLAAFITLILMAANMYLALKVGLTFSTTLPAAVISMAVLSRFKNSNILENTAVQTFASTGGTSSAIVFALPALIIVGTWANFPYWQTTLISLLGGLLGVFFTIPLRRALVVESEKDLPFPEGTAAAEVLKVGETIIQSKKQNEKKESGIGFLVSGGLISAAASLLINGFKLASGGISHLSKIGGSVASTSCGFGFALVGAGYLIGARLGLYMLAGTIFANWVLIPYFSASPEYASMSLSDISDSVYTTNIRYIGVGCIAVAALWSIITLIKPLYEGIMASIRDHKANKLSDEDLMLRTEKDIPVKYLSTAILFIAIPLIALIAYFIGTQPIQLTGGKLFALVLFCVFLAILIGFIIAAIAGYMAGLIGSSNSPISGLIYLTTIIIALVLSLCGSAYFEISNESQELVNKSIIGIVLFIASLVLAMAACANDNLQDLKTGQIVGATPWKQQTALLMGVAVAALIVSPVFNMLYNAYGLQGAPLPHPNMDLSNALNSPQSNIAAALTKGIVTHTLNWNMLLLGGAIGVILIALDYVFKALKWPRISLFSFSIAIYLPMDMILPIVIGGIIAYFIHKKLKARSNSEEDFENQKTPGVLVASGLIVGEALMSIFIAGGIGATGNQNFISLVSSSYGDLANYVGLIIFIIGLLISMKYMLKRFKLN